MIFQRYFNDTLLIIILQRSNASQHLLGYCCTTETGQHLHHLDAVDGHNARQDRHTNSAGNAAIIKIEEKAIVIEVVRNNVFGALVNLQL